MCPNDEIIVTNPKKPPQRTSYPAKPPKQDKPAKKPK